MTKTTFAGTMRLDGESLRAQSRLESLLPRLCPNAKHTTGQKRPPTTLDREASIEWIALGVRSRVGTFEEIENDGVEAPRALRSLADDIHHVTDPDGNPRVRKTIS